MPRPNILILYTDQQRWDALGVNGNPDIKTPNLDRLASEGVNFPRFFVQNPVCMPSRISMLSSRYPSSLGIYQNGTPVPLDVAVHPVADQDLTSLGPLLQQKSDVGGITQGHVVHP